MKRGVESLSTVNQNVTGRLELASYCDYFLRQSENGNLN